MFYESDRDAEEIGVRVNLIQITPEIFVDPSEVVSVEHDQTFRDCGSISDPCMVKEFDGTRITLKNGRKVFINHTMPSEVISKLSQDKKECE